MVDVVGKWSSSFSSILIKILTHLSALNTCHTKQLLPRGYLDKKSHADLSRVGIWCGNRASPGQ